MAARRPPSRPTPRETPETSEPPRRVVSGTSPAYSRVRTGFARCGPASVADQTRRAAELRVRVEPVGDAAAVLHAVPRLAATREVVVVIGEANEDRLLAQHL